MHALYIYIIIHVTCKYTQDSNIDMCIYASYDYLHASINLITDRYLQTYTYGVKNLTTYL